MTAIATQSAPVYVQQSFLWDEADTTNTVAHPPRATAAANTQRTTSRPSSRPPVTVPVVKQSSSVRRGRCEHVGGILASVLERYGLTVDQLLAEMDGKS